METQTTTLSSDPGVARPRATWATRGILALSLALAIPGLGLGLTIPLTMPVTPLMLLRIGAAELCLWLLGLNLLALLLSWVALRRVKSRARWWAWAAVACSIVGGVLAAVPAVQIPGAAASAEAAMQLGLGKDYASRIPAGVAAQMRSTTFSIGDYIKGIDVGSARLTKDIPYCYNRRTVVVARQIRPSRSRAAPWPAGHTRRKLAQRRQKGTCARRATTSRHVAMWCTMSSIHGYQRQVYRFPGQLEDIECALGYMRYHARQDNLDPERVVTFGRSAGAHLALLTAYRGQHDPAPAGCEKWATVKATVAYYAPTDLRDDYMHPAEPDLIDAHTVLGDFLGGAADEDPGSYESASPQHWLDRPVPPTMLIQGESDQIVLSRNTEGLAAPLRAAHNTVVSIKIPWAGHGFDAIFRGQAASWLYLLGDNT